MAPNHFLSAVGLVLEKKNHSGGAIPDALCNLLSCASRRAGEKRIRAIRQTWQSGLVEIVAVGCRAANLYCLPQSATRNEGFSWPHG